MVPKTDGNMYLKIYIYDHSILYIDYITFRSLKFSILYFLIKICSNR